MIEGANGVFMISSFRDPAKFFQLDISRKRFCMLLNRCIVVVVVVLFVIVWLALEITLAKKLQIFRRTKEIYPFPVLDP